MKKALVIGSEGSVGIHLVKHLQSNNWQVLKSDIKPGTLDDYYVSDINHPIDLLPAFESKPDVVFLLSAMRGRIACEKASSLSVTTNLSGVNNVAQLCKLYSSKLIYVSTSEIYGPDCDPMHEDISNPNPNNRYGLTKLLGEKLIEYEVRTHGLKAVTLRPFMIYNENEEFGAHRSAMIRFACELAMGNPIEVHKGSARGWLHISDAVNLITESSRLEDYHVINIGNPDIQPMAKLAELLRKQLKADKNLIKTVDLPVRMTGVKNPVLEKQQTLLGIVPEITLEEGLKRVCLRVKDRIQAGELPSN